MNRDSNTIFKLYVEAVEEQPQMDVDVEGNKRWRLHDVLHREDGPAFEGNSGRREWHLHGKRHREGGPAIISARGTRAWFLHDKLHREDGAAIEYEDGSKSWYLHGRNYRDAKAWAEALLRSKNKPSDEQAVAAFLHNLNKKMVNELM